MTESSAAIWSAVRPVSIQACSAAAPMVSNSAWVKALAAVAAPNSATAIQATPFIACFTTLFMGVLLGVLFFVYIVGSSPCTSQVAILGLRFISLLSCCALLTLRASRGHKKTGSKPIRYINKKVGWPRREISATHMSAKSCLLDLSRRGTPPSATQYAQTIGRTPSKGQPAKVHFVMFSSPTRSHAFNLTTRDYVANCE